MSAQKTNNKIELDGKFDFPDFGSDEWVEYMLSIQKETDDKKIEKDETRKTSSES